ncbi:sn-glycerol-3-phosphate ABC transporter ATP-binding protein UgpC [Pseudovibrio sp. Tun.PSC04-5.I4]|uniref:ABC transporter ATP-binding protein n=1 Tax=Pseudovibrio sp. Tun.PSC04-5.I4 TaxID=1798213 RepID=UPI00087F971B|nr:sn-glycerol-3-phosphate ABC transporter ATP-binding protein UgpC [Pseudovibrio sp. Tun.PSC04-5.I4]SDR48454.1 carbohydrate ABC transporter ATP-binding protein, CUT1 family [Pseudovibrio sp. Tun.PSC04-5.I4]
MAELQLCGVKKSFGSTEVIRGIDLTIEDGSFTVFVGPSGCGKSTLLRMISGLEEVTEGSIHLEGARCDHLMPGARSMAMVFQTYALYPHMNVAENLRFGLENQKLSKSEINMRIERAAGILQIQQLMHRKPSQLSGGQSQRVAIGRAIVKEPKAFLFDEPLSNLDAELRHKMRNEIVTLHSKLKATMVYVTHDQVEAMTMADTIVVLNDGRVEQVGSPLELYARPDNLFVAAFLGAPQMNFVEATVLQKDETKLIVASEFGELTLQLSNRKTLMTKGDKCTLGIRPEHAQLSRGGEIRCRIRSVEILGSETILHCELNSGRSFTLTQQGILGAKPGETLDVTFDPAFLHLFDQNGVALHPQTKWQNDYVKSPELASVV